MEHVLVCEEFCRKDPGLAVAVMPADFGSEIILRCGDEEQKRKYLPLVASGQAISPLLEIIIDDCLVYVPDHTQINSSRLGPSREVQA
ncbi:MAG: acyl-CoA dehydrogenase family protein [Chloroflexi bacterium]|nr:acyl-CoA dehydrogenase family protein [Chloroflexota bacterium]